MGATTKNYFLKKIKDYIIVTIALTISAVIYNVFLSPLNIVSGGTGGAAIITKYIFNIDRTLMIFILSTICFILSMLFLGKEKSMVTIYASFAYPLLVKLTELLTNKIIFSKADMLIVIIFAGVISGFANGLIYKQGYNSGGFSIISQILYDKLNIAISKTSFIISITIISLSAYLFGATKAMYAIIFLYLNNIVMDKIILGISKNKAFYIITSEEDAITKYIIEVLGHDITCFEVKGGYLEKKKSVILAIVPSRDYYKVTEGVKIIDKEAFFIATDSYEVKGAS